MSYTRSPLISIIIPTYNRAHLLSRSIDSVLNQTFRDYEIIVVDDASSDNTRELLNEKYHDKIIYIGKERNEGLSAARNTGIKNSRGKYLAFLDDDDAWFPEKLELQIDLMEQNPSFGLVYCGYYEINRDGKIMGEVKPTKKGYIFDDLLCANCVVGSASAALVKREVFVKTGYFDENLSACEDWDMWIRVSKFYVIDFIDQPLVKCMIHDYSMSSDLLNMEETTFSVLDKYWPELSKDKKYEERKNKLYSDYCVIFAWRYYQRGNRSDFERLLFRALDYYPLNEVFVHWEDLQEKEKVLFAIFDKYWDKSAGHRWTDIRKKAYIRRYMQLAWEYYHHNEMRDFRRCVACVFQTSFPKVPLRLIIPFLKSFMGRNIAERIHRVRKCLNKIIAKILLDEKHASKRIK